MICKKCGKDFSPRKQLQRYCGKVCALMASKETWGKFTHPYTKRSKEEGLIGNMIHTGWPKSSHGGYRITRNKIMTIQEKFDGIVVNKDEVIIITPLIPVDAVVRKQEDVT